MASRAAWPEDWCWRCGHWGRLQPGLFWCGWCIDHWQPAPEDPDD